MSKRRTKVAAPPAVTGMDYSALEVASDGDVNAELAELMADDAETEQRCADPAPMPETPTQAPPADDDEPTPLLTALENVINGEVSYLADEQCRAESHAARQAESLAPVYAAIRAAKTLSPAMSAAFVDGLSIAESDEADTVALTKKARNNLRTRFNAALKDAGLRFAFQFVDAQGKPNRQGRLVGAVVEPLVIEPPTPFETVAKEAAAKAVTKVPTAPSAEEPTIVETAIADARRAVAADPSEAMTQEDFEETVYSAAVSAIGSGLDRGAVLAALSVIGHRIKTAIQDDNARTAQAERAAKAAETAEKKRLAKEAARAAAELAESAPELMDDEPAH